jgi:cytochrome P450
MKQLPTFGADLYSDPLLDDPYSAYRTLRDLGPVVWLSEHQLLAIGRFADARAALRADKALVSGAGVAANDLVNRGGAPITLTSDGDTHARRRRVLIQPVSPGTLRDLRPEMESEAQALVARLATGDIFCGVEDFASHLPVAIVARMVGLNEEGRRHMLRWAAATFDALGVMNPRGLAALPIMRELGAYVAKLGRAQVAPGGWADRLFDAADRGDLSAEEARAMIIDYVAPSLDTTILATGFMLHCLATVEGAYDSVRRDPALVPSIVNEAMRWGSPLKGFTRFAIEDVDIDGQTIPTGSRVLILYASANHDERHYHRPESFVADRNPRDHVGWGHGPHTCVGMHLARLEMEVLLGALIGQVERIEVGTPIRLRNNVLQGFTALPTRFQKLRQSPGRGA